MMFRLISRFAILCVLTAACGADPERAKQEYLKSGDDYASQGKYREAIVEYRNALQQDARFGEARLKLAQSYEKLGNRQGAHREFIRAADALPSNLEAQVKAATYLLLARQFEDARARAGKALALDPKNVEAQLVLGNALGGLKDFDGAIKELQEAVELDPASAAAYSSMAMVQLAQGRAGAAEAAEAAFRRAVETNPKLPAAHLSLANFLWSVGRVPEAEKSIQQALVVQPDSALAHRALTLLYLATGRAPEAEPHLKALADKDTSSTASLRLALADYYIGVRRSADAIRVLEPLADMKGAADAAQTRLAAIKYLTVGKDEGNRLIEAVLARDPKDVQALLMRARFKLAEGNLDQSLASARSAAAVDPRSIQARYLMGTVLRQQRKTTEAIEAFNEVLNLNPRAAAAQVQLAQLNLRQGQANTALQLATDAARQQPSDPRVQLTLVHALVANNQVEQAQRAVAALQKAFPNVAPVQAAAGTVALARRDQSGARQSYTRAAELDPANLEALSGLVRLDFMAKKPADARARVDQRLAAAPNDPALLTLAARVAATAGDGKRSEELLRKVVEIDPSNLQAFSMLGQLFAGQGRTAEARASFEAIVKDRPDAIGANTIIGMLYEVEGNHDEARKRYERVVQIDPAAAVASNNLAYLYAERGGNLDIALQLAQAARQKLPESPEVADTLGWVYVKKDMPALAIPRLEEAVKASPSTALLHYHLGVALTKSGQRIKGRETLERALAMRLPDAEAAEARRLMSPL